MRRPHSSASWVITLVLLLSSAAAWAQPAEEPPRAQTDPNFWVEIYDPDSVTFERAMARGKEAAHQGRFEVALKSFEAAVAVRPGHAEARVLAASAASGCSQHAKVKEHLLALRAIEPDADTNPEYVLCFRLGLANTHLGAWSEAISEYEQCVHTHPDWAALSQSNAAELAMALGELDQAEALYEASTIAAPEHVGGLFGLAVALDRQGKTSAARAQLIAALYRDPGLTAMFDDDTFFEPPGEVHYQLGVFYRELGRFADAKGHFELYEEKATKGLYHAQAKAHIAALEAATDPLVERYPAPAFDTTAAVVDSDLQWLAVGTASGRISALRLADAKVFEIASSGAGVVDIAFTRAGKELRVLLADGKVARFNPRKGMKDVGQWSLQSEGAPLALTADGQWGTSVAEAGFAVEKLGRAKKPTVVGALIAKPLVATVSPDQHSLAYFAHKDGLILELDGTAAVASAKSYGPRQPILSMEALPDGSGFVLGMPEGVIIHRLDTRIAKVLLPYEKGTRSVALDPAGRYLTVVVETSIEVWQVDALELMP